MLGREKTSGVPEPPAGPPGGEGRSRGAAWVSLISNGCLKGRRRGDMGVSEHPMQWPALGAG